MEAKDYIAFVTTAIALIALWRTQYIYGVEDRKRKAKEIESRLNEFYSPLLFYIRTINHLYCEFAATFKAQNPSFRTIPYLLQGNVFCGNDAALLEMILDLEYKVEEILVTKSGLVESVEFSFPSALSKEANDLLQVFRDRYADFGFDRKPNF